MKLLRSRKALSPVVASIILIAVTVAVSLAVAAFLGALPGRYTAQPELNIWSVSWNSGTITLNVTNTGTAAGIVSYVKVNQVVATSDCPKTINPGAYVIITITYSWSPGQNYMIELYEQSGKLLTFRQASAPTS